MDCNEYLSDWKKCLFVKLLKDQDRINEVYRSSNLCRYKSAHRNDVFQYKDTPSWHNDN